ncbi:MAG TPA: hypothetical protein VNT76_03310, partial [Candidatus Binatus sp.]|nr:hypothetical protein [Candidatus Binatus sp.]
AIIRSELRNGMIPREGGPWNPNEFLPPELHLKEAERPPMTPEERLMKMRTMGISQDINKYSSQEWVDIWGTGCRDMLQASKKSRRVN